jgi:phosphoenolpyruvate carboxylase
MMKMKRIRGDVRNETLLRHLTVVVVMMTLTANPTEELEKTIYEKTYSN